LDNINIPQVRESPTFEKRRVVSPALPQIQEQNILYIEDNTLNQLVMTALISDLNLGQLHIAATGAEALALTPTLRPKLLLVDIHLPDCTGVELLSRIRAIDGCESIPAIAVSADAMPEHIDAALAGGFDHYLTKPVNIDSLSKAAARHLEIVTSPGTVASDNSSSEA
jgi:CheY-like chemotaxis protein